MNYLDYNCQEIKNLNNCLLQQIAAAYTGWDASNVPESFGVAFHHIGPTFINAYIISE